MLSRRVIAYYGLIRGSDLKPPETRASPIYSACLYSRAALRTPANCTTAPDCYFIAHAAFARFALARHSLTTKPVQLVVCLTRLQVSLYATARRACSPCTGQDFYFRAFVPVIAHRNVEYDYMGIQSIPMAGLSPARHAALWAAHKSDHKKHKKCGA
jgi:hypothetical protein